MGVVALWLRHDLHSCRLALAPEGKSAETTILSYFFLGRRLSSLHAGEPKSLRRPSGYLIPWAAAIFSTSDAPIITSLSGGNPGEIYWCLNYHLTFPLSEPTFNPEVKEHRKQSCISVWLLTCAFRAKGHEILNQVELIVCVTALSIHTPVFFFFLKIWILHLCQQEVPLETGDDCQMKCSLPLPWHWIEWIISARFTEGEAGVFLPAAHRSPAGSDSTAAAVVAKTGFGKDGSSLSQDDSAAFFFFFTRRSLRCHDTERGGKSLLWYCHGIVRGQPQMTGGVYSYKIASTEACSSVDRCPTRYSVRQKDSHRLLFTRAWQTNSSRLVGGWEQGWKNLFVLPVCFPGRDVATWAVPLLWGGKKMIHLEKRGYTAVKSRHF